MLVDAVELGPDDVLVASLALLGRVALLAFLVGCVGFRAYRVWGLGFGFKEFWG